MKKMIIYLVLITVIGTVSSCQNSNKLDNFEERFLITERVTKSLLKEQIGEWKQNNVFIPGELDTTSTPEWARYSFMKKDISKEEEQRINKFFDSVEVERKKLKIWLNSK